MVNAFSFCVYNPPNPKYYTGLLENLKIIQQYFPGWITYIYTGNDVPPSFLQRLRAYPNTRIVQTGKEGIQNMIERFFAIDDPDVELMMVRDADSRIHWKDRWAIQQFVSNPDYTAHAIRDHKEHTSVLMGGLWGLRKTSGLTMKSLFADFLIKPTENGCGLDQGFLAGYVYNRVFNKLLVHHSNHRGIVGETAVEFPFVWSDEIYCGKVELGDRPTYAVQRVFKFLPSVR